jgi:uncharacterized membrane protein
MNKIESQHNLILDNIRYRVWLVPNANGLYTVYCQIKDYKRLLTGYSKAFNCPIYGFGKRLREYHQNKLIELG